MCSGVKVDQRPSKAVSTAMPASAWDGSLEVVSVFSMLSEFSHLLIEMNKGEVNTC